MGDKIKLLKALANEVRFEILEFLLTSEKCVCEIFPHVKKTQSTVSLYLGDLEKIGILESRKEGKKVFYKIKDKRICDIFKALGNNKVAKLKNKCCCKK